MTGDAGTAMPMRVKLALYAIGLLNNGATKMFALIVPLWAISLDASPFTIGVILGSGSFLPMLLSIHGGTLMDRWGARRTMMAFAVMGLVATPLFPLMPWVWALVVLQMLLGYAQTSIWTGAQAFVGQMARGDTAIAGRLVFSTRLGMLVGPPVAGLAWDLIGPWGGFGLTGLWGLSLLAAIWILPEPRRETSERQLPFRARELVPRFADYRSAFGLLKAPAVTFLIVLSMLNLAVGSINNSFYVVFVQDVGYSATLIGILASTASFLAAFGTLAAAPLTRAFRETWVLHLTTVLPVVAMILTPFLGTYGLFVVAMAVLGFAQGVNQPLVIAVMSRVADSADQGKAAGLRATTNRVTTTLIPIAMGAVVELAGLGPSFVIVCGFLLAAQALLLCLNGRLRREGSLR